MAQLGNDLENGAIKHHFGQTLCCGWHDDSVWFCASSQPDLERELLDGVNYLLEVCAYPVVPPDLPPRTAVELADDGMVLVAVETAGSILTYGCRSYLTGFVAL